MNPKYSVDAPELTPKQLAARIARAKKHKNAGYKYSCTIEVCQPEEHYWLLFPVSGKSIPCACGSVFYWSS